MSRLNPREALEVSPFDTGVFSWKMRIRAIQENHWLQIDDGREEDLLEKKKGPVGIHLPGSETASLTLLKTIDDPNEVALMIVGLLNHLRTLNPDLTTAELKRLIIMLRNDVLPKKAKELAEE